MRTQVKKLTGCKITLLTINCVTSELTRVKKLLNLRIFEDGDKPWSKSVVDLGLEILCVSQVS